MKFGDFLKESREAQGFSSYRQLEDETKIDHAYIWRLERGDNSNPSDNIINELSKTLRLTDRQKNIFKLLAEIEIPDPLFRLMLERTDISWDTFESTAKMSNRGKRPNTKEDWLEKVLLIDELL